MKNIFHLSGPLGRGPYFAAGLLLAAIKHNLDRLLFRYSFGSNGSSLEYVKFLSPDTLLNFSALTPQEQQFTILLWAAGLPFVIAGAILTFRRLRDCALSPGFLALFAIPYLNLIFFAALSLWPSQSRIPKQEIVTRIVPHSLWGGATAALIMAALLAAAIQVLSTALSVNLLRTYGWTLFVALPFCQGFLAVLIYAYHQRRDMGLCVAVATLSIVIGGLLIFALAMEGAICLVMALPIGLVLGMLGGIVGYFFQRHRDRIPPATLAGIIFALPLAIGIEGVAPKTSTIYPIRSSITIAASPETVWKSVVTFSELPPPTEWLFRQGLAYPIRAEITGSGPGAIRKCIFSTGAFIEPIEIWDEPHLLKFSVTQQPPSMTEWSPYPNVRAPHVEGWLVSHGGQFLLTRIDDTHTLLEGTTWYQHSMWPEEYWKLWSDAIIHKIHMRVLNHIKVQSENGNG